MKAEEKKKILDACIERIEQIPTLPHVVSRILEMSNDPDVRVELLADAILKDKALTARMIRMVNSAFWGIQRQVASIREAIVYLGLQQIRNIVLTTSLFNTFRSRNPSFRITAIWEHGLGCAMISRSIAEIIGYADSEKAYLAGLLHDIGEVVLSQFCVEEFHRVIDLVHEEGLPFYEAERRVMAINHTDFASWFREQWKFSDDLTEVIATHHTPEAATIDPPLVSIVVLGDLFCRVRGLDYGHTESIQVSFMDEFAWRTLAATYPVLDRMDIERFTFNLDGMVDEVKKVVKEVYRDDVQGEGDSLTKG